MVNLQIGNSDWAEQKESYELVSDDRSGGDDDDDNGDDGDDGDDGENGDNGEDGEDGDGSDQPSKPPPVGFFIGVYSLKGLDDKSVLNAIEPAAEMKKPEEFCCRIQASLPPDSDLIAEACRIHPKRARENKFLHKQMFLVADSTNIQTDGIALVHLDWDGNVSRKSPKALQEIGTTSQRKTQRCECTKAVQTLCTIARDFRKWTYSHWCFGAYTVDYSDSDIAIATLLDKRWSTRGHAQDLVIPTAGLTAPTTATDAAPGFWKDVMTKHATFCQRKRFTNNFHRQLCFVCDSDDPDTKGIWLVKLDWDGNLGAEGKGTEELLKRDYRSVLTMQQCPVAEAYKALTDIADGKKDWQGVEPQ
ncbi:MAG: hypothetical protein M1830_005701 [Pleopsidium flavum]|nr:MAG: hypothetical protein M1830_005701 [Pleopsidium flavum]